MTNPDDAITITPHSPPIEADCECGAHHVIDPAAIERFLRRRKFRCAACRQRWPMRALSALVAGDPPGGICMPCDREERP